MARHIFNFDGGEHLTTMGAVWFVSFSYYNHIDRAHDNWRNVETHPNRSSVFYRTQEYHIYWLKKILDMDDGRLDTNSIDIDAETVKKMARMVLEKFSAIPKESKTT